jgi:hypothetical protein
MINKHTAHPLASLTSTKRYQDQAEYASSFTRAERLTLWVVAAAFVVPFNILDYRFFSTEIAILIFIAVAVNHGTGSARVVPLLAVFAAPVAFAFMFPPSNYSFLTSVVVYAKIVLYVYFVFVLVQRCRNRKNVVWLARMVIVPVALVLSLSALVDQYTDWPFFIEWRRNMYWSEAIKQRTLNLYGSDPWLLDKINPNSGFAPRTMDIIPWAVMGTIAGYWLQKIGRMKSTTLALIFMILVGAAFSMPKRSAVVTLGTGILAFLVLARREAGWRTRLTLLLLAAVSIVAVTTVGQLRVLNRSGSETSAQVSTALSRFLYAGFTGGYDFYDDRVELTPLEIDFLLHNPRELFLGTGWIFAGGIWANPHDTYTALIIGGGLVSAIPFVIALSHLFRGPLRRRRRQRRGVFGVVLLISLSAELMVNGYLAGRLEYLASILAIWIAWTAIMYKNPPLNEEMR